MAKLKTTIPFKGTAEQEKELRSFIEEHKDDKGALMPVLQKAQDLYGYLPIEVQTIVSRGLDVPLSEVYGVVTFYSMFSLSPKGKHNVQVCMGTACYVKGSGLVLDRLKEKLNLEVGATSEDGLFSIEATRCVGACGLAPVIIISGDVYGRLTPDMVDDIVEKYD
jgi:NADP-reducing hydrogenase subunit HndA